MPIYATLEADVVYKGSALSLIIKYVQDLFDLCAFSVSYALLIFSMLLLSKDTTRLVAIFYSVAFFVQIPLKILMNAVVYGSIGNSLDITIDVIYLSVYFAFQMIQLLVVYIFSRTDSEKYLAYVESTKAKDQACDEASRKILPFSKFIDWYNPLLRSVTKTAILILAIKLITRIINDITYGAPTSLGEVLLMTVYYLSDIIYGIVAYVIMALSISVLYDKVKQKSENKDEESPALDI